MVVSVLCVPARYDHHLWPMPSLIGTAIWGDQFDAWTTLWLIDPWANALRTATGRPSPPRFCIRWATTCGRSDTWRWLIGGALVAIGVPLVISYNVLLMAGIWTSALGAHALGLVLTAATAPQPWVPLRLQHRRICMRRRVRVQLVAAGLLPLYTATLVRLIRQPSRSRWIQSTACGVDWSFNWYYTLFAGLITGSAVAWQVIRWARARSASRPARRGRIVCRHWWRPRPTFRSFPGKTRDAGSTIDLRRPLCQRSSLPRGSRHRQRVAPHRSAR